MTAQGNSAIYNLSYPGIAFQNQNGICQLKTAVVNGLAVGANQLVITAVSGKKLLIVGGNAYSNGAATTLAFLSASGGTLIRMIALPANTVATPNVPLTLHQFDQWETKTGEGLYCTNSAVLALVSVTYVEYTP